MGTPRTKVLLVDSDELAASMVPALHRANHDVRLASFGGTALRLAESFAPDVVVADTVQDGPGGVSVLSGLRAAGNDVPVVLLTLRGERPEESAGLSARAQAHLDKPFTPRQLVSTVDDVLAVAAAGRVFEASGAVLSLTTATGARVVLDRTVGSLLLDSAPIAASERALAVMECLMRHCATGCGSAMLHRHVLGFDSDDAAAAIAMRVAELRAALGDGPDDASIIAGIPGGYTILTAREHG